MLISAAAPALRSVASPSRASSCLRGWMLDSDSLAVGPSSASEWSDASAAWSYCTPGGIEPTRLSRRPKNLRVGRQLTRAKLVREVGGLEFYFDCQATVVAGRIGANCWPAGSFTWLRVGRSMLGGRPSAVVPRPKFASVMAEYLIPWRTLKALTHVRSLATFLSTAYPWLESTACA